MKKSDIKTMVENALDDVMIDIYEKESIQTGDVTPLWVFRADVAVDEIVSLICEAMEHNGKAVG